MKLRFVEDGRTLVWAFCLFPLGPALALWRPSLLPFLAVLLVYCSYLSGVLSHNHNHVPVFRGRRSNLAYGAWLSVFYGFPIVSWLPTHNQNHHRYTNGKGDVTATSLHAPRDGFLAALTYPLASSRRQLPSLIRFAREAFQLRSAQRARILVESAALVLAHGAVLGLAIALHGAKLGSIVYACALGLPSMLGTYWMMLTNYLQHVGCVVGSEHDHSRNFVGSLTNWLVFDNGFHTVHHDQPTQHWSRYRELHAARARDIAPELNRRDIVITYLFSRYARAWRGRASARAAGVAERSWT